MRSTNSEVDLGARCDAHIGEAFPPRCAACAAEAARNSTVRATVRLGFIPGSACDLHLNYPLPCALCARIESMDSL
jgi:hypothetical protein